MGILLSDEELQKVSGWQYPRDVDGYERNIAKAQLKKAKNWLEIYCESGHPRRECGHCWQALLREVNEEN